MPGSVVVGVLNTLPVKSLYVIFVNDLAVGQVIAEPKVVIEPVMSAETDKIVKTFLWCDFRLRDNSS